MLRELKSTGQNWAGMRLGVHMPAYAKLETHMEYITHLEHDIVRFPICSQLIIFYTIGNNDNTYMSQIKQ